MSFFIKWVFEVSKFLDWASRSDRVKYSIKVGKIALNAGYACAGWIIEVG
jgi:hypothetical protein